jgi:eukaryotic-like serine/threonine-protein kinase
MAGSGHRRVRASGGTGESSAGASARAALPDRYETIGLIARGGMASVWAARDRKLDREVAVKLLAETYAGDAISVRRFKREARAAARLSGHPHVVTIYDVGQRPPSGDAPFGRPFIVMEFLAGGTVAEAARIAPPARAEVLEWLRGAAAALDHAHERGVVHRDVKPSNFLLDDHRVLHVADFGIASLGAEETLTGSGRLLGTAAYLAPERALGQPATAASDRYSLAVAAFELLAGERPFTAHEAAALARQHVEASPPPASSRNPGLPTALDAVLQRGMAKEPEQRWPTAAAFADAIERTLAPRRRRARRPAPVVLTPAAGRRRGVTAGAVAAAALAAGIAVAAGGTGGPKPSSAVAGGRATAHPPPPATRPALTRHPHRTATVTSGTGSSSPPPTGAPPSADALETHGHALMDAGDYAAAIPVLRQATSAASPGSLTYAYALYDLGRSLRLSGDPQAAIPILWRRLAIPNQTGVVRTELQLAMRAAGQHPSAAAQPSAQPPTGGAAATGKHDHPHHGHGSSGGAALPQGD